MTKTKETRKSTRPAPVELHDEALDRIAGGATPRRVYSQSVTFTATVSPVI